jgi:hypothetical protein
MRRAPRNFWNGMLALAALAAVAMAARGQDLAPGKDDRMILTAGEAVEISIGSVKIIPMSAAPPQLLKALGGDVFRGPGQ